MTSYIRSIRPIERTTVYAPIQAVTPYGYYPYRDGEAQQPPDYNDDWNQIYLKAADSAATWFRLADKAQQKLDQITSQLSRKLHFNEPIDAHLKQLSELLNQLEYIYKKHADELKPDLWETVELALRHPAAGEIGLRRSSDFGEWIIASNGESKQMGNSGRLKQLMLGVDGMLNGLKTALTYADEQTTADLVQPYLSSTLPYSAYYGAMQSYWPLPHVGLILNRYL
ncbi:hypothetical protein [Paenibacillus sp. sgz302251]|uniref:hypothetical protein n=1 Tax=Paenibacillus sp. sgz302251 TaxID=3414493 RepID=UPI003C7A6943